MEESILDKIVIGLAATFMIAIQLCLAALPFIGALWIYDNWIK